MTDTTRKLTDWFRAHPVLVALTVATFLLRVAAIGWGLPGSMGGAYHADESKVLAPAVKFLGHFMTGRPFPLYGTSLQYTLGPLLAPFDLLSRLTGMEAAYQVAASAFCRLVVVLMGAAAIPLLYRYAEGLYDRRTALIAALLLAVTPYHVLNSAIFTLDVPMATLLLVNLLLIRRLTRNAGNAQYVACGLAFGYMLGMKLSAALFVVFPIALYLLSERPRPVLPVRKLALSVAAAIAVLVVLNPQLFFGFDQLVRRVLLDKADFWDRTRPDTLLASIARHWAGYAVGIGVPIMLAAIAGIPSSLRRQRAATLALLAFLAAYGFYFGHRLQPRYTIFLAPVICLFAAVFCARLIAAARSSVRASGVACLVAMSGLTLFVTSAGVLSRLMDPRVRAARYIAETFPEGTTVGFGVESEEYADSHNWRFPALYGPAHRQASVLESPDIIVTASWVMHVVEAALDSPYISEQYEWAEEANDWWYRYSPPSPALFALYARLRAESGYRMVKSFATPVPDGLEAEFVVEEIRIYERDDRGRSRLKPLLLLQSARRRSGFSREEPLSTSRPWSWMTGSVRTQ